MASNITNVAKQFRQAFTLEKMDFNWFPGHMARGVKQMQGKLKNVDCIIEVHDARIPFSGRNPHFYHTLTAIRPHILLLNKMDLANLRHKQKIETKLMEKWNDLNIIFSNCQNPNCSGIAGLIPKAIELIKASNRFNRSENTYYTLMTIGIPNVGKSSLINSLRVRYLNKGGATQVGANPGVTRNVLEKIRICDEPTIYLLDTPGVLEPNIKNLETGMKLALCATLDNYRIGVSFIADYLLFWMNKNNNFNYVNCLGLKEPTDNINEVLLHICIKLNFTNVIRTSSNERKRFPNLEKAAGYFIREFRNGRMGKFMLDLDHIR